MNENSDQVDAAAREAARQARAGGPNRARLDMSRAREIRPGENPGADKLAARLRAALAFTRLEPCQHIPAAWQSGSAIPVHWAAWRPERAACERCFTWWLAPEDPSERCDLCGGPGPTDYLLAAAGPAIAHGDVCDKCQGK